MIVFFRRRLWVEGNMVLPPSHVDFWNSAPNVQGIFWGVANTYDQGNDALRVTSWTGGHNGHSFYLPIEPDVEFTIRALIKNVTNRLPLTFATVLYNASGQVVITNYTPQVVAQSNWLGHNTPDFTEGWLTYKFLSSDLQANFPTAAFYTIQLVGQGLTPSEIYLKDIVLRRGTDHSYNPVFRTGEKKLVGGLGV